MNAGHGAGGMDPFEEMLARFFGGRARRRPPERVSIARLMSERSFRLPGSVAA